MKRMLTLTAAAMMAVLSAAPEAAKPAAPAAPAVQNIAKGRHFELAKGEPLSGVLEFTATLTGDVPQFKIIFKGDKGQWSMFWHFDKEKVLGFYNGGHNATHVMPATVKKGVKIKYRLDISRGKGAMLSINGKRLTSVYLQKPQFAQAGPVFKSVVLAPEVTTMNVEGLKWTPNKDQKLNMVLDGQNSGILGMPFFTTPKGDYELTFKFKSNYYGKDNTHYGFELQPVSKSESKIMVVIWRQGFQTIQGKGGKWIANFPDPKTFNGKWHSFKMKLTDGNFYEFFVDDKLLGSYEGDLKPGALINFWSYGQWHFEIDDLAIKSVKE